MPSEHVERDRIKGLPPKPPTLLEPSAESVLISKLQAEKRVLQLQLLEKKILECSLPLSNDDAATEGVAPPAEEPEPLDLDTLDAVQLQLFSLRKQLQRERRFRLFLQKTLSQEVHVLRIWMEHDRIRHREQLQRLQHQAERIACSSRSLRVPLPPMREDGTGSARDDTATERSRAAEEFPDPLEEEADDTSATPPRAPEEPQFYYKYSAPVTSESEGQTKAIIEQTASRSESRRKHLASLRLSSSEPGSRSSSNPPKVSRSVPGIIRLRGSSTQLRDRRVEDPSLRGRNTFVNPNQIGEEIHEDKKSKAWYLRHALTLAFLKMIPASVKSETSAEESAVPITPKGSHRPPLADDHLNISAFMGVNSSSMQRAINEVAHLQFHLSGNKPVLTVGSRSRNLPRLEEENNDPDLLKAMDVTSAPLSTTVRDVGWDDVPLSRHQHARGNSANFSTDFREDELRISFHSPVIFNQIREFLMLDADMFREAVQHSSWRESMSPGKSGTSLIYFADYVMKSLPDSDYAMLTTRYLPAYVKYCEQHPQSLLTRFYAIISVKWLKSGNSKCYVLMQNVFSTRNYIHRIYDVKGSTVGRSAIQPGKEAPRTAFGALLLKDNDLPDQLLICGPPQRKVLLRQLKLDLKFLEALSIVDYSMMIGVRSRVLSRDQRETRLANATKEAELDAEEEEDVSCLHRCDGGLLSLPIKSEDDTALEEEEVYYLGVIDVLQEYNSTKKLENFAKGFYNDRTQISVIPPPEYAERLYRSIERISR